MPTPQSNQLALSTAQPREIIAAREIIVGDFTHITGYRRVCRVDVRPRKRTVRLHWVDGSSRVLRFDERVRVHHGR